MGTNFDNTTDVFDSRDVIEAIEELQNALSEPDGFDSDEERIEATERQRILIELQDEADFTADWQYGETLIRDSYFEDYAEETAEGIGAIDPDAKWPLNHIDWKAAAAELQEDYTSVDFDGVTYWIRS